jgi:MFS family permease
MNRFPEYLAARIPFFYGYVVVFVAVLAQICSSAGQTFAIAAFTPFLQQSLDLSASKLAGAFMLGTILAAVPLSIVGPLSDRYGLRSTTAVVGLGLSAACVVLSLSVGFFSLLLGFLLLRFLGQGSLMLLSSNMVSMWFHERLGRVNAAISLGAALAFGAIPILLLSSIEQNGWRFTYAAMGGLVALTLVPLTLLLVKDRPEDIGLWPDGADPPLDQSPRLAPNREPSRDTGGEPVAGHGTEARARQLRFEPGCTLNEAIQHRTFWILSVGLGVWAMIGTGIIFYALPIFEQYGIAPERSKLLFSTFSASMLIAQIGGGILADRGAMHRLLACGFALLATGALVIPLTTSEYFVHLFALLFGAGQGLAMAVNSTMWVRYYGRLNLGKIRGAVWCSTVAGSGAGPFVLGFIHDTLGSFTPGLLAFGLLLLPLAPLSLWATAPIRARTREAEPFRDDPLLLGRSEANDGFVATEASDVKELEAAVLATSDGAA